VSSRLSLLVRRYCHLCDEMAAALEAALAARQAVAVVVEEIDVDADPALEARFGWDVPVLLAGEQVICRHRLDPAALAAWLSGQAGSA
jgi:thioredoxin reductase (NADPH)